MTHDGNRGNASEDGKEDHDQGEFNSLATEERSSEALTSPFLNLDERSGSSRKRPLTTQGLSLDREIHQQLNDVTAALKSVNTALIKLAQQQPVAQPSPLAARAETSMVEMQKELDALAASRTSYPHLFSDAAVSSMQAAIVRKFMPYVTV